MASDPTPDRSPLEAFLEKYWKDREEGCVTVREYLDLFPGDDAAIATEWVALQQTEAREQQVGGADSIGPYRTIKELGRGGQGVVYLAEDSRLHRNVAVKVLTTFGPGSEDTVVRFQREAEVASKLEHPGICGVHDVGVANGVPYIAMQFVQGETLAERIGKAKADQEIVGDFSLFEASEVPGSATGVKNPKTAADTRTTSTRIDKSEVMRIVATFEKIARALHAAHEVGIIHRDIKPGNIMLSPDGQPVILDFGLARDDEAGIQSLTRTGDFFGTPAYMSPEQLMAQRVRLDRRTDVYSLGATLYECLTLARPFEAPTREALYQAIMTKEPPDVRRLNRAVTRDLEVVVEAAIEKDRDRRYQTALDLAEDLLRIQEGRPILARAPGPVMRAWRWARRNPTAAALLLVLLLGAIGTTVGMLRAERNRKEATANLQTARENERRARAAEEQIEGELKRSRALNLAGAVDRALDADPVVALLLALKAVELDANPETLGRVQTALANQYLIAEFRGHSEQITCADFGATNRRVLTGSRDGTVRLWTEDGEELSAQPHGGPIVSAKFSRNERCILTVAAHGEGRVVARIYDLDGELRAEVGADGEPPLASADWDADGSRALVRYADGGIALLNPTGDVAQELTGASRGVVLFSPEGHAVHMTAGQFRIWPADDSDPIVLRARRGAWFRFRRRRAELPRSIAFDPRGELIATTHRDDVARLWSRAGELVGELVGHTYTVNAVRFSPSGDVIATASGDGTARLWTRQGDRVAVISHGAEVQGVRFLGSESRVLTWNGGGAALWNDKGKRLAELQDRLLGLRVADVVPREGLVLTCGGQGVAGLWRLAGVEGFQLRGDEDRPWDVACRPTGEVLASSENGRVVAWGTDGHVLKVFDSGVRKPTYGVAVSPDGSLVVAGGYGGMIYGWDWRTTEKLWERKIGGWPMTDVHFLSPGNRIVVSSAPARAAHHVDLESGTHTVLMNRTTEVEGVPPGSGGCVFSFVSPDRAIIALTTPGGVLRLCDAEGAKLVDLRATQRGFIWSVAFHPGGEWLWTATERGMIKLWDLDKVLSNPRGVEPTRSIAHGNGVGAIAIAPDGTEVLVAAFGYSYVADLEGNERIRFRPFGAPSGSVLAELAFFSPDGKWLIGGGFDGARRAPAREEDLLRLARKWADRLGRNRDLNEYAHLLDPK